MSDIEARREARRKKVLANAEDRLKKITGVEQRTTKSELDSICLKGNFDNLLNEECTHMGNIHELYEPIDETSPGLDESFTSDQEISTIYRNSMIDQNDSVINCEGIAPSRSTRTQAIIILPSILSLFIVIADILSLDLQIFHLNKIFIPLIAFEIIECVYGPSVDQSPSFLLSVLPVINRNGLITTYLRYMPFILKLFHDLFIYFFIFICSHTLWKMILDGDN